MVKGIVGLIEGFQIFLFMVEGLNNVETSECFFHLAVDVSQIVLLRFKIFLRAFYYLRYEKG